MSSADSARATPMMMAAFAMGTIKVKGGTPNIAVAMPWAIEDISVFVKAYTILKPDRMAYIVPYDLVVLLVPYIIYSTSLR